MQPWWLPHLLVPPRQVTWLCLAMAENNWLCSSVLQGFVAPASDAPIKVVNVYGQQYNSPASTGLF